MSIYPTRTAAHIAIAGLVVMAVGIALRAPVVVAWGGAVLVGIVLARAVTLVSVMRIRAAGFEMLWTDDERVRRTQAGGTVVLRAEVRNRDTLSARFDKLRVVASPALETRVVPLAGEVPATGSVSIEIHVKGLRAGYHGVYGLALEVRGAPGLFEVPLTFANPYGVEVLPRALHRPLSMPRGGRSRTLAPSGRPGRQRGEGTDLRELREHMPGDPFRRIAWKASAKRGKLVVRDHEREERDVVVLVLDASVELWSGPMGGAPLDHAIELCATLATHHVERGDLVGLYVVGSRVLAELAPDHGRRHLGQIASALMSATMTLDADRSGWDEADMASQVAEHLRPIDPAAAGDLRRGRLDKLARRASAARVHAPFARPAPAGKGEVDARLRKYAACYGMFVPSRLEPDGLGASAALGRVMAEVAAMRRPRASIVHVVAPAPSAEAAASLQRGPRRLRGRHVEVRWTTPSFEPPPLLHHHHGGPLPFDAADRPSAEPEPDPAVYEAVREAVVLRARVATKKGERLLRAMGVKLVRVTKTAPRRPLPAEERVA